MQPLHSLTGSGITATVSLVITDGEKDIEIYSPLNTTYNFSIGDPYALDLNVSANFEVDNWWYTLYDVKHNEIVNNTIAFSPNISFNAVRWSNEIRVYAEDIGVEIVNENVTFFVYVPNSAPVLYGVNDSIFICEREFLNNYFFYAVDVDEQVLELMLNPVNPFYLDTWFTSGQQINTTVEMFSGVLDKNDIGLHEEIISVSDGEYSDYAYANITVVEINNAPVIENIGVQTVWTSGDNSTFNKQVKVADTEDGNQDGGVLNFSISFFDNDELFNISENGTMYFVPNSSQVGVYNIRVCVNDTGIDNPADNIFEICGQDGGSITTCQNFSLTITDENRAPTITNYYPVNLSFSASGTSDLYFNISKYDPDGTIPDAYWYVDGVFIEYDSGNSTDEFIHNFGCDVSGAHAIKVEITDGLLNDSITWNIGVQQVACTTPPSGGGGGGGGGGISCTEEWACESWEICQGIEKLLKLGILSGEDYRIVLEQCFEIGLSNEFCGAQIRNCSDLNGCNTKYFKPAEFQICYYTQYPNCNDGIKNCHDDSCEVLVDCGGPCSACPTCSDKIQNQGEEGIDCGGPCAWKCPEAIPLLKRKEVLYSFIALIVLLILVATVKIIRIFRYKNLIAQE